MTRSRAATKIVDERKRYRALTGTIVAATATVVSGIVALHVVPGVTLGDVLALSIAVGIMQIPRGSRIRLGLAFSASEVLMQVAGYAIGAGAGRLVGAIADYLGFAVLAAVGAFIFRESFHAGEATFKADSWWSTLLACASISLDSLGIGRFFARRAVAPVTATGNRWGQHRHLYDRRPRFWCGVRSTLSALCRARGRPRPHRPRSVVFDAAHLAMGSLSAASPSNRALRATA